MKWGGLLVVLCLSSSIECWPAETLAGGIGPVSGGSFVKLRRAEGEGDFVVGGDPVFLPVARLRGGAEGGGGGGTRKGGGRRETSKRKSGGGRGLAPLQGEGLRGEDEGQSKGARGGGGGVLGGLVTWVFGG